MTPALAQDDFAGRVAFAAAVIAGKRATSRRFANCFENDDGDEVTAALMRKAEKGGRLAANLPLYLDMEVARDLYASFAGKDLPEEARKSRERARIAWEKTFANSQRRA